MGVKMNIRRRWRVLSALLVIIAFLAGCQAESPTAPSPGGSGGGGGTTPPQGATITLAVTDRNPQLNGVTEIVATVTQNGAAVPNGTAVEFSTDLGTFIESGTGIVIRTTVGGVTRATLTSANSGVATVTARVNNVNAKTAVTFGTAGLLVQLSNPSPSVGGSTVITVQLADPALANGTAVEFSTNLGVFVETNSATAVVATRDGVASATLTSNQAGKATVTITALDITGSIDVVFGGGTALAITSIAPARGTPAGGEEIVIRGRGFQAPVRVLFGSADAVIVSATSTEIRVRTPQVQLGPTEQARDVSVTVISGSGTTGEQQVTQANGFRFELPILTPTIINVSPSSGPNEGNTRITIIGEGFQSPVRVYFGTAGSAGGALDDQVELDVQQVTFNQIIAMTPPAVGLGAELRDQQVVMRVLNVASNKDAVMPRAFRYGPRMQITAVGPNEGPYFGGTKVTIYGYGFDDPVAVTLAGVAAQPIRVSGTEVVVNSSGVDLASCGDISGDVVVTNIEDGSSASIKDAWTYRVPQPTIGSVTPSIVAEGGTVQVAVVGADPTALTRFTIGELTLNPTAVTVVNGVPVFTVVIPAGVIEFPTTACTVGTASGQRNTNAVLDVVYTNVFTGCTDTLTSGVTVTPLDTSCIATPVAVASPTSLTFSGTCGTTASQGFTITNTGGPGLIVNGITSQGVNATVTSGTIPTPAPGLATFGTAAFTVGVALPAVPPAANVTGTISVATNGGTVQIGTTVLPCTP